MNNVRMDTLIVNAKCLATEPLFLSLHPPLTFQLIAVFCLLLVFTQLFPKLLTILLV